MLWQDSYFSCCFLKHYPVCLPRIHKNYINLHSFFFELVKLHPTFLLHDFFFFLPWNQWRMKRFITVCSAAYIDPIGLCLYSRRQYMQGGNRIILSTLVFTGCKLPLKDLATWRFPHLLLHSVAFLWSASLLFCHFCTVEFRSGCTAPASLTNRTRRSLFVHPLWLLLRIYPQIFLDLSLYKFFPELYAELYLLSAHHSGMAQQILLKLR